jgi:hypothetical protein
MGQASPKGRQRKGAAKQHTLVLDVADVLQVLDALDSRAEAWEFTYRSLTGTTTAEDDAELRIAEECHRLDEAADIAQHFRDIIKTINAQTDEPDEHEAVA